MFSLFLSFKKHLRMPDLTLSGQIVANGHSSTDFKRDITGDMNLTPKFYEGAINRKAILGGTEFSQQ